MLCFQAQSERGLALCKFNSVCNVLYRRFWFRMRIERLCRCPHRSECPMEWSSKQDNYTMSLSNRSQLKVNHCTRSITTGYVET
jgi:hypothetical protein